MERVADRRAFARAWTYLNYNAAAKWSALVAAVITGVLYVALLALLWLFADLMVHRGQIPAYADLGSLEQRHFWQSWQNDGQAALRQLGLDESSRSQELASADPFDPDKPPVTADIQRLLWRVHLFKLLHDQVGSVAAVRVLPGYHDLPPPEQAAVLQGWKNIPPDERRDLVRRLVRDAKVPELVADDLDPAKLDDGDRETLWLLRLDYLWGQDDRADAAGQRESENRISAIQQALQDGTDPVAGTPADSALADRGILSLLVRTHLHGSYYSPVIGWMARWNPLMWKTGPPNWPNFIYFLGELLVLAILIAFLWALASYAMRELAARATIEAATRLRRSVYHHTFRLGTLAFRALGPSEAVTVFTRHVEAVHDGLYYWITVIFREPVKFCLLLAFALIIHPILALCFLLAALLVWLIGGQAAAYYRQQGRTATNQASERLTLIRESLMLMRLVKCYMMELFNQSRVERQLSRFAAAQRKRYRGEAISLPLLAFLAALAGVVVLAAAGVIVLTGRLSVAGAITLVTALVSLYWPLTSLLAHRRFMRRARESAVHLFQFLDRPGEVGQVVGAEFLQPLSKQLEFDNVSLREPGTGRPLLQDVSFTVKAGEKIGFVGAEDLEKHALVYLIPRLLDPHGGEIRIDDHNLRWVTLDSLRKEIAIVLQHNLVFHDTVANNISCGDPEFKLPQVIEAAKMAHAHSFIQKLPQGYETPIGELGHALDTGQQFRIALARAIVRDPAVLIIEEPEKALDDDVKSQIDDTFTRILPNRTVIFLPHRISTIRSCDQVYLIHKGRLEAAGVHRELLANNQLYRHLHYLEFSEMMEQV
jgi:ATP-binding cassette subfamily B protein